MTTMRLPSRTFARTFARTLRVALSALVAVAMVACASRTRTPAATSLRVMTFNIAAGNGNLSAIAGTIRENTPDIVALQEVDVHWLARSNFADQAKLLGEQLGMQVRFAPIYSEPGATAGAPRREYGVALLSKFPVEAFTNQTQTRLTTQQANAAPTPMPGLLDATVNVNGVRVRIFNTHLDYRPDPSVRVRQVAEMMALIGDASSPTLVFGDLNATPSAPELAPFFAKLRDAWTTPGDAGLSYPATSPTKRIDYVLTSSHFRATNARVPATLVSDHRPVVVDLTLDGTTGQSSPTRR